MDLTEDEKERLKGYYKVAKKLEKMESAGNPSKWVQSISNQIAIQLTTLFVLPEIKVTPRMNKSRTRTTPFPVWIRCPRTTRFRAHFRHASVQSHPA